MKPSPQSNLSISHSQIFSHAFSNPSIPTPLTFFDSWQPLICLLPLYYKNYRAKTRPRADCGSDHELLIAKFRLKLKKVGKTPRPFRYDLKHIPYDYTVEVRTRFKGLDLIDRVPDELWTEVCDMVQETGIKTIPKKKKCKKAKWLSEEALQISVK